MAKRKRSDPADFLREEPTHYRVNGSESERKLRFIRAFDWARFAKAECWLKGLCVIQ